VERFASRAAAFLPVPGVPGWLNSAQILLLDAGLLFTLYLAWKIASQTGARLRQSISLFLPWALLSSTLYATGIWILLHPMPMRGVIH
jgi:hypothetical protein